MMLYLRPVAHIAQLQRRGDLSLMGGPDVSIIESRFDNIESNRGFDNIESDSMLSNREILDFRNLHPCSETVANTVECCVQLPSDSELIKNQNILQ